MKADLYAFVAAYSRGLETLSHLLTKGAKFATANGSSEAEMLEWRLTDDMMTLRGQAQTVRNFAMQWPARAAGLEIPAGMAEGLDLAGVQAAIAEAKAYLAGLKPEQFEGRDDAPLTVNIGAMEPTFATAQWLPGFATPNFYFHLSMAYAILRARGAPLGKRDFFAGGL